MRGLTRALALILSIAYATNAKVARFRPTVDEVYPGYRYSKTIESLRAIDFRNFVVHIFEDDGKPIVIAHLRNGKYESRRTIQRGSDWVRLDWVKAVGIDSEYAVVALSWVSTGASASDFGVVQVFALQESHPVVMQQILFNTRGCRTAGASLAAVGEMLVIKGVHGWEHCCPTKLDIVTFGWVASAFKQRTVKSALMSGAC